MGWQRFVAHPLIDDLVPEAIIKKRSGGIYALRTQIQSMQQAMELSKIRDLVQVKIDKRKGFRFDKAKQETIVHLPKIEGQFK